MYGACIKVRLPLPPHLNSVTTLPFMEVIAKLTQKHNHFFWTAL